MAKVKAVVPETVFPHGYAVLNADDDLVYAMKDDLDCNIALFSMDENNPRIKEHCAEGGLAAVFENGFMTYNERQLENKSDACKRYSIDL